MNTYLFGLDIGTTSTKAVIIDTAGQLLAEATQPGRLYAPQPAWAEAEPEEWWGNVCRLIPVCLEQAGLKPGQIAAVGVSGMVPTVVLLDGKGQPIRPSIQQNDARAVAEIEWQRQQTGAEDILRRTGSPITQQSIGPKLLWLRRHEPELMAGHLRLMGSYDFIVQRLTGAFSIERNWALESGLFDLQRQAWNEELLHLATIDKDWLAPVHWPAEVVGQVTPQAAGLTGLQAGTPVVAGSADHVASAFSAGLKREGELLVKLGGAGDILCCIDRPQVDPRLFLDYHVIPGQFLLNGCMAASGSLIRWYRDQFAPGLAYAALDQEAAALPAGAEGLIILPYFLGEKTPINDPLARGTVVGLTLAHTRSHLYRAILEGITYGFYHHLEIIAEHGYRPTTARVTNGGAHSSLWRQITADVLNVRLEEISAHPGSSLGAAFVAGMGVGAFEGWGDIERFIRLATVTEPDLEHHARYLKLYALYREIYESLKDKFLVLAGI